MVSSVLIYPDVITFLGSNIAQAGATFGVAAKTKDKELREMAIPAGISALLAGVTEPAMYGVRLRLKKPMITISHYEVPFGLTKKCNAWVSREMITYYLNYCRSIFTRYKGKAKYWIKHAITGIPINGTASIGFITIVTPNRTGSLIPNNAGIIPTLPSVFNCFDFAKKNIYITSPIVIPAPVILIN